MDSIDNSYVVKTELKPFQLSLGCGVCRIGFYHWYEGETYTSGKTVTHKYFHRCNNCGDNIVLEVQFPRIVYEEVPM